MSGKTKVLTKGRKQGSANRADFHTYCSVFHADSRGAIYFSKKTYRMQGCGSLKF